MVKVSAVSEKSNAIPSGLTREVLFRAFQEMSDELGRRDVPVKAQYLVEGLFAEGKI